MSPRSKMKTFIQMGVHVALLFVLGAALTDAQSIVNVPGLGSLQGITSQSFFTNRTIYEFRGIPYAERPVRFSPPVKKAAWEGVWNATAYGRVCPQINGYGYKVTNDSGDPEDCLFLDVYSPKMSNNSKLPVLFFIHGGAFALGTSQMIQPQFLLEHDIVLVAPQYRLGPLGFLSLGIENASGNTGLFDQLMALQWVYDHIEQFGGDPNRITMSGVSAGAASAALQYVSPLTQGMIQQVMLFSGSAIAQWTVGLEPVKHSYAIAEYAGCKPTAENTTAELLSCLQSVGPFDIMRAYNQHQDYERMQGRSGMDGTNPVIDHKFLNEMPMDILSNPNFTGRPMLMSVVKNDGTNSEEDLYEYYLKGNNLTNDNRTLKYGIPDVLLSYIGMSDISHTIGTAIKDQYFRPQELGDYAAMRPGIIDFLGSAYFKGPAQKMAELNDLRGGQTFLTTFNYYSHGVHQDGGVPHGSDQAYLFPTSYNQYEEEDLIMVHKLTQLYTNFIIQGTPNGNTSGIDDIEWAPYSQTENVYLCINTTSEMRNVFELQYTIAEQEGL